MSKKLFIKTYGCQMNVYDSARMADLLAGIGYGPASAPDDADMVIVNTCHIRERAAEKFAEAKAAIESIQNQLRMETEGLIELPEVIVPEADLGEKERLAPLISSKWTWAEGTIALKARKAYQVGGVQ